MHNFIHKGQILIGALGLALAPAIAAAGLNDPDQCTTITIQAGQGSPISLQLPAAAEAAPYALTGSAATPTHEERMDLGQGASVLVRLPD